VPTSLRHPSIGGGGSGAWATLRAGLPHGRASRAHSCQKRVPRVTLGKVTRGGRSRPRDGSSWGSWAVFYGAIERRGIARRTGVLWRVAIRWSVLAHRSPPPPPKPYPAFSAPHVVQPSRRSAPAFLQQQVPRVTSGGSDARRPPGPRAGVASWATRHCERQSKRGASLRSSGD